MVVGELLMKGQMFIVAGVFVMVGLVLLFNLLGAPMITEEKRFQETRITDKNAENIMEEYKFLAGMSSSQDTEGQYLQDFSSRIRNDLGSDSGMLYVFVLKNGTTQAYDAIVGNYLGTGINATVNSSGVSNSTLIQDRGTMKTEFPAGAAANVTISYTLRNGRTIEMVPIAAGNKNYASAFFDVALRSDDYYVRLKDEYNRTW